MLRWRVLRRRRRSDCERPRSGMVEGGGALRADAREPASRVWRAVSVVRRADAREPASRAWRAVSVARSHAIWLLDGEWCSMANRWERLVEKCPLLRGEREVPLAWRHSAVPQLLGGGKLRGAVAPGPPGSPGTDGSCGLSRSATGVVAARWRLTPGIW